MNIYRFAVICLCSLFFMTSAFAATDSLKNSGIANFGDEPVFLSEGMSVRLPDGRIASIEKKLDNGLMLTNLGIVLYPNGIIAKGENEGDLAIVIQNENQQQEDIAATGKRDEQAQELEETVVIKEEQKNEEQKNSENSGFWVSEGSDSATVTKSAEERLAKVESSDKSDDRQGFSIAELLPTITDTPKKPGVLTKETGAADEKTGKGSSEASEMGGSKKENAAKGKTARKSDSGKTANAKETTANRSEKSQTQAKEQAARQAEKNSKQSSRTNTAKARAGQELRIPPNAARTGDLSFLEGCWQGTRPEYYTKRTIKECFCFDASGRSGKRRVSDPIGRRQCIGSSRATLSAGGVLSVKSSGAACSDGERWGQAEMVCRNSGPRTPCSWVFKDAANGSQAYEIPFIRVQSCARK